MAIFTEDLNNEPSFSGGSFTWDLPSLTLTDTDTAGTAFNPGSGNTRSFKDIKFVIYRLNQGRVNNGGNEVIEMDNCILEETQGNATISNSSELGHSTVWRLTNCLWHSDRQSEIGFGAILNGDPACFQLTNHRFKGQGAGVYFVNMQDAQTITVSGVQYASFLSGVTFDNAALHTTITGLTIAGAEFSGGVRPRPNQGAYTIRIIGGSGFPTTSFSGDTTYNDQGNYSGAEGTSNAQVIFQGNAGSPNTSFYYLINNKYVPDLSWSRRNSGFVSPVETYMYRPEFPDENGVLGNDIRVSEMPQGPTGTITNAARSVRSLFGGSIAPGTVVSSGVAASHIVPHEDGHAYLVVVDFKDGQSPRPMDGSGAVGDAVNVFLTKALNPVTGALANPDADEVVYKSSLRNISGELAKPLELSEFTTANDFSITITPVVYNSPVDVNFTRVAAEINLLASQELTAVNADQVYDNLKDSWANSDDASQRFPFTNVVTNVDGLLFLNLSIINTGATVLNEISQSQADIRGTFVEDGDTFDGVQSPADIDLDFWRLTNARTRTDLLNIPADLTGRRLAGSGTLTAGGTYTDTVLADFSSGDIAIVTFADGEYIINGDCDFSGVTTFLLATGASANITITNGSAIDVFGNTNLGVLAGLGITFTTTIEFSGFVDGMNIDLYDYSSNTPVQLMSGGQPITLTTGDSISSNTPGLETLGGDLDNIIAFVRSDIYVPQILRLGVSAGSTSTFVIADTTDALRPDSSTITVGLTVNTVTYNAGDGITVTTTGFADAVQPQALLMANEIRNTIEHSRDVMRSYSADQAYAANAQRLVYNTTGFTEVSPDFLIGPADGSATQFYAFIGRGGSPTTISFSSFTVTDGSRTVVAQGLLLNSENIDYNRLGAEQQNAVRIAIGASIDRILLILNYIRGFKLFGIKPQTPE